jgi:tetratricopeptide (TPR) repeat protein
VREARAELEKLARERPEWALVHLQLGQTLLMLDDTAAALRAFDRAEQASADPGAAGLRMAQILLGRGQPDLAIARARSALDAGAPASAARL